MHYRTDPLTDDGKFDVDFFGSSEFETEQKSLVNYLNLEGFDKFEEEFVIDYRSRRWHIKPNYKKKNKK
jgi:hypothetical protein